MKLSLGQKILTGFIICTVILTAVGVFAYKNNEKFVASNDWVEHTHQVLFEFGEILNYNIDLESSARGYVITGDDKYLETFANNKINLFQHLNQLRLLTGDNTAQQKNLTELEKNLERRLAHLENVIDVRKESAEKATLLVTSGEGKRIQDGIKQIISRSTDLEKKLLAERKLASEADARNFNIIFGVLLLIIVGVLIVVYLIITANLRALRKAEIETESKNWLLTGTAEINDQLRGEKEAVNLAQDVINQLCIYMNAQIGAIYISNEDDDLQLIAGYAFDHTQPAIKNIIRPGEGMVGQAAMEKKPKVLRQIPADYIKVNSGLGNSLVKNIIVYPFLYGNKVKGVIEVGGQKEFSEEDMRLLGLVAENIGIAVNSSQSRSKLKELLEETQVQSEELQSQQEELRQINEELEEQAQNLKQQQEELQITNEELEEQTQALEMKNREVEAARHDIEMKTRQLEASSRYKSEFLANMSHELRTPLNSLLILSKDLSENKRKNLTEEQVESADIIYRSGHDLLLLINEVLDLSKIEAGKMTLHVEEVSLQYLSDEISRNFKHQAERKGLRFNVSTDVDVPQYIKTDEQRLNQIIKNLLSNAIKFTANGSISVNISRHTNDKIAIAVSDTGIGIPEDKQLAIFEAFQQADGGTSRKYGGTGLGLSISRELARLLKAEIKLESKLNEGSTFTIIVPISLSIQAEHQVKQAPASNITIKRPLAINNDFINYPGIEDDRNNLQEDDKIVLIIEDDLKFAGILLKQAHTKGFKCLCASTGEDGLALAKKYYPQAIILDLNLPGIDGHTVLLELKSVPATRHIPVHIISAEERSLKPIKEGAVAYMNKPIEKKQLEEAFNRIENFIDRKMKNLLIIEDDANSRKAMKTLIGNGDVKCVEASSGAEALKLFSENHIDCIVLDIGLPDMSGFDLIHKLNEIKKDIPPIIIYTGRELSKEENDELQKYAESIIIKGVKSEERLLDETALFLHRTISNLPEPKQHMIASLYDREIIFQSKKVLLVDDDMRNVFALSKILKERGLQVVKAENGLNALEMLEANKDVAIILMDIMMPEMDGYEAMRRIRAMDDFKRLPIIALTAKAMKDDKQKCIDAGATDYISKPVDVERLLTLMRVWLSK
ncbi:MAG TPA: response regulator [Chitinophagales bacterium]|nr:response regulator [Chitinophagales bacterium]